VLWRTHFLAGAAAGVLLAGQADVKAAIVSAGIAGIAALLPDLDDPRSKLGRVAAPASRLVKAAVGHRGPLHSLAGAAAAFLLAVLLSRDTALASLVAAGYTSHLLADSLNPHGVPWLWPCRKRFGLPLVRTGSALEKLVVMPAAALLVLKSAVGF